MGEQQQALLRKQLWDVANNMRGNMNASDFMYFSLGFIFYKFLSEKIERFINEALEQDKMTFEEFWATEDKETKQDMIDECLEELGYFVEPEYLFQTIIAKIKVGEEILPLLEKSMKLIEESTLSQESEEDFVNLFSDIDLASPKLGRTTADK
ncbi:MAG TPA: type I restriction-modification system subunit M N-terminal domain-containing protein, partial [Bacteroidaceae bacterium]|nr:type I restriction-modification system subunit M N-terminal domain-containing protein [Bacteroidaceae bacterium]